MTRKSLSIKKLITLVTLAMVTMSVSLYANLEYRTGWFFFQGAWHFGEISGSSISVNGGIITANPPATSGLNNGTVIDSPNERLAFPFNPGVRGKVENPPIRFAKDLITYDQNGIKIYSQNPIEVTIYGLDFKVVYYAQNVTNVNIDKGTLASGISTSIPPSAGYYMLRVTNNEGGDDILEFMFVDDSFMFINYNNE